VQGAINNIVWNVYEKIKSIDKVTGSDLEFAYDATGNRIMKKVTEAGQPTKTTYYSRDAQGNVMAVYTRKTTTGGSPTDSIFLSEQHIYGSSRLGYVQTKIKMTTAIPTTGYYSRVLGEKSYELSNHLGNVLAVVSDRRLAIKGTGATAGKIIYFEPDVLTAQDYDPGGMILPGRMWVAGDGNYRFSFQGQEHDDEFWGGAISFNYRVEDSRLMRFFSVDPLTKKYAYNSPYAFSENRVIDAIELEGLEKFRITCKQGYLCVTLIDITTAFEVEDMRTGKSTPYWPEKEMDKQLNGAWVNQDKSALNTPDGSKFYNPNGQGPMSNITPANFLYIFSPSDPTNVTYVDVPGGTYSAFNVTDMSSKVTDMIFAISGMKAVDHIFSVEGEETWDFGLVDYNRIDITVADEFKSSIQTQIGEWGFDTGKINWITPIAGGPDLDIKFKTLTVDRSDYDKDSYLKDKDGSRTECE